MIYHNKTALSFPDKAVSKELENKNSSVEVYTDSEFFLILKRAVDH